MFYGNPNFVIVFTTYFDLDDSFFFYISALYSTAACCLSRCDVYSFVKILYKFHTSVMHFACLEVCWGGFIIEFIAHRMQNSCTVL